MSYASIESTLKTILQGVTALASTTTQGDYRILDKGVNDAAVIYEGGVNLPEETGRLIEASWECSIDIFKRYTDEGKTHTEFVALRDAVLTRIITYFPNLNNPAINNPNGYKVKFIVMQGQPQDMKLLKASAGPVFRAQTLTVTIQETIVI